MLTQILVIGHHLKKGVIQEEQLVLSTLTEKWREKTYKEGFRCHIAHKNIPYIYLSIFVVYFRLKGSIAFSPLLNNEYYFVYNMEDPIS